MKSICTQRGLKKKKKEDKNREKTENEKNKMHIQGAGQCLPR